MSLVKPPDIFHALVVLTFQMCPQTSLRGVIRLYEIKSVKGLIWEPEVLKSKHYGDLVEIKDT